MVDDEPFMLLSVSVGPTKTLLMRCGIQTANIAHLDATLETMGIVKYNADQLHVGSYGL